MSTRRGLRGCDRVIVNQGRRGLLIALLLFAAAARADPLAARRALAVLGGLEQEYREAFAGGAAVVHPRELAEARLLLRDLSDLARGLTAERTAVDTALAGLTATVDATAAPAVVADRIGGLRAALVAMAGTVEEFLPPQQPAAARGARVFRDLCASCHGTDGSGAGPAAAALAHPPADFTDRRFMRSETPADFFHVVSLGRRTAGMPSWRDALGVQERWDAVSWVWSLGIEPATLAAGAGLFAAHCADCHGATAPLRLERLALRSDADLDAAIARGSENGRMPAFADRLSGPEGLQLVAYLRAESMGVIGAGGPPPPPAVWVRRAIGRVRPGVTAAVEAYRLGDPDAAATAGEAYLIFEPVEPAIAAEDPAAVTRVEAAFQRLRAALRQAGAQAAVESAADGVGRALDAVSVAERAGRPSWVVAAVGLGLLVLAVGFAVRRSR